MKRITILLIMLFAISNLIAQSKTYFLKTTSLGNWNLIVIPNSTGIEKASDLTNFIDGCESVSYWHAENQGFEQYLPIISETDFKIIPGVVYVNVNKDIEFTINGDWNIPIKLYEGYNEMFATKTITSNEIKETTKDCVAVDRWNMELQKFESGEFIFYFGDPFRIKIDKDISGINYPNPFNKDTNINYTVKKSENIKIDIYNILGQRVDTIMNAIQQPGTYTVNWNSEGQPSGVYFCKINSQIIKMRLVN